MVQEVTDTEGGEVNSKNMWDIFATEFLDREAPLAHKTFLIDNSPNDDSEAKVTATVEYNGSEHVISGHGNGPIAAYANALEHLGIDFEVIEYSQQSRTAGDDAEAACYIAADVNGTQVWGAGIAGSTTRASIFAINSAVNRALN